jgi:hypothetical protein
MKHLAKLLLGTVLVVSIGSWLLGVAAAQLVYDVANYKALADAGSTDTIPPGTKITLDNWQKYKKFMQLWMQAAYEGKYKWRVGKEPQYRVEVGATQHYPWSANMWKTPKSMGVRPSSCGCRPGA